MRIYPFPGIRFAGTRSRPGDLAAPPYDQIDGAERDRLQALDPRHFSHLSRPLATDTRTPHESAAHLHSAF